MRARYLSQIREESDRDQRIGSTLLAPPTHAAAQPIEEGPDVWEQQKKQEENRSLLEEVQEIKQLSRLSHIEAELRESLQLDVERQRELEFLRLHENKVLQQNLNDLSLSQRIARPWVSSYFRKIPMHIYCLPIRAVNHRGRRRGLKKNQ